MSEDPVITVARGKLNFLIFDIPIPREAQAEYAKLR